MVGISKKVCFCAKLGRKVGVVERGELKFSGFEVLCGNAVYGLFVYSKLL